MVKPEQDLEALALRLVAAFDGLSSAMAEFRSAVAAARVPAPVQEVDKPRQKVCPCRFCVQGRADARED